MVHTWIKNVRVGRRRPEAVVVVSAQLFTSAPVMRDVSRTDIPWCPVRCAASSSAFAPDTPGC